MRKLLIFLILIVIGSFKLTGAPNPYFKKFGKVASDDFKPTALDGLGYPAVILQSEKTMYFDQYDNQLMLFNRYHIRIKALQDGFHDDDLFTINYSGCHDYEQVVGTKCWIFSQSGQKISCNKVKLKNIRNINPDSLQSQVRINLPEVRSGDIIDLEYILVTFDFMLPPIFKFNSKYPSVATQLVTHFPDFMQYKYDLRGSDTLDIQHVRDFEFFSTGFTFSPANNPNSMAYLAGRVPRYQVMYKFNSLLDTFRVFHVLPVDIYQGPTVKPFSKPLYGTASVRMKAMKFTQNIGYSGMYYTAWQQFTHLLYTYANPDNRYLSRSEAWHELYHSGFVVVDYMNWNRFHKRLFKSPQFWKPLFKSLRIPEQSDIQYNPDDELDTALVVGKLYAYVQKNIKWDSTFANHLTRNPDNVLKTGKGNSADINMTLVALLRKMGVDAYPVLAATTNYGDVDTSYANMIQFNTVLACVRLNELASDNSEVFLLLDATSDLPVGELPYYDKNGICLSVPTIPGPFLEILEHTHGTYNAKKIADSD